MKSVSILKISGNIFISTRFKPDPMNGDDALD